MKPMKLINFIFILFMIKEYSFIKVKLVTEDGTNACSILSPELDVHRHTIIDYCIKNKYCSEIFHQSERKNLTIF